MTMTLAMSMQITVINPLPSMFGLMSDDHIEIGELATNDGTVDQITDMQPLLTASSYEDIISRQAGVIARTSIDAAMDHMWKNLGHLFLLNHERSESCCSWKLD
jgi:hypothetical protein